MIMDKISNSKDETDALHNVEGFVLEETYLPSLILKTLQPALET